MKRLDPDVDRHLLVCGPEGSGRTTLARLAVSDRAGAGWGVTVVTDRPGEWSRGVGVTIVAGGGQCRLSAEDLAFGSARTGPTLVVVDDPPGMRVGAGPGVVEDLVATPDVHLLLVTGSAAAEVVPAVVVEACSCVWLGPGLSPVAAAHLFGTSPERLPRVDGRPGRGIVRLAGGPVVRRFTVPFAAGSWV